MARKILPKSFKSSFQLKQFESTKTAEIQLGEFASFTLREGAAAAEISQRFIFFLLLISVFEGLKSTVFHIVALQQTAAHTILSTELLCCCVNEYNADNSFFVFSLPRSLLLLLLLQW